MSMGDVFDWRGFPARWLCVGGGRRELMVKDEGGTNWWEPVASADCKCPNCETTAALVAF